MQLTYIATTRAQRNVQPYCFPMQYRVFIPATPISAHLTTDLTLT